MSKTLENLRTGKYEVVDNQGVSVTQHFIECLEKEFADLEAKLAEKDEQIKRRIAVYEKQFIEQTNENCELKQQLAEKDKELKQLKLDLGMFKSVNEFINRYGIEKAREVLLQTEKTKRQDKISFAIEQLEKVKELLNTDFESIISWIDPYEDGECLTSMTYNHNNTIKMIDNQINELKGE